MCLVAPCGINKTQFCDQKVSAFDQAEKHWFKATLYRFTIMCSCITLHFRSTYFGSSSSSVKVTYYAFWMPSLIFMRKNLICTDLQVGCKSIELNSSTNRTCSLWAEICDPRRWLTLPEKWSSAWSSLNRGSERDSSLAMVWESEPSSGEPWRKVSCWSF